MGYKNRPITDLVNKAYIKYRYYDKSRNYQRYDAEVDITIETIGDLRNDYSLTIIFKFTVPSDFPSMDNISRVIYFDIWLYHTSEGTYLTGCIYISAEKVEYVFGKYLTPGEEAQITFTIPALTFLLYSK
jgi:hypothetical protein